MHAVMIHNECAILNKECVRALCVELDVDESVSVLIRCIWARCVP